MHIYKDVRVVKLRNGIKPTEKRALWWEKGDRADNSQYFKVELGVNGCFIGLGKTIREAVVEAVNARDHYNANYL